jgi:hypothetical protein
MDSPYVAVFVEGVRKVRGHGKAWRDRRIGMARAIDLAPLPQEDRERAVNVLFKLTGAEVAYQTVLAQNFFLGVTPLLVVVVAVTLAGPQGFDRHFLITLAMGLGVVWGGHALMDRVRHWRLRAWFRHDATRCSQDIAALFSSVPQYAATQDMLDALGATDHDPAPWILAQTQSLVLTRASGLGSPH